MKVKAIWEFEVDTEEFSEEFVDVKGLAKDLTQREMENLLQNQEIVADDFSYELETEKEFTDDEPQHIYETIFKSYVSEKKNIDSWFSRISIDKMPICKREDIVECIFHIGKAYMLAQIIETEFSKNTKEEKLYMKKIKEYLEDLIKLEEN